MDVAVWLQGLGSERYRQAFLKSRRQQLHARIAEVLEERLTDAGEAGPEDLLAPIYGWFTEGFDTQDPKDAKALLDELA